MNSLLNRELCFSDQKAGTGSDVEKWRSIPGYEGIYEASTFGRIRTAEGKTTSSARFKKRVWQQRILKAKVQRKKRPDARVDLWKGNEHKTYLVSRLVGMTWCDGYSPGLTINHIDGDCTNNRAENLEWVTLPENIQEGVDSGLFAKSCKPVTLINCSTHQTYRFPSMAAASRFLGMNSHYLSTALKRGMSETHAYRFEVADDIH